MAPRKSIHAAWTEHAPRYFNWQYAAYKILHTVYNPSCLCKQFIGQRACIARPRMPILLIFNPFTTRVDDAAARSPVAASFSSHEAKQAHRASEHVALKTFLARMCNRSHLGTRTAKPLPFEAPRDSPAVNRRRAAVQSSGDEAAPHTYLGGSRSTSSSLLTHGRRQRCTPTADTRCRTRP
jgi:hypothetical protein